MQNSSVRVRVPASTSNLGSGFDTLGLALNLYCTLTVHRATDPGIRIISKISDQNRMSAMAMLSETAGLFFAKTKTPAFGTEIEISSEIPPARGMGASAALRVGFLAALGRLARLCMAKTDLLEMATALEHHPDNASPAIYGGFTVSGFFGGKVHCIRLPVSPNLRVVTLVPDLEINTTRARTLLPESYSKADTAHALNRCGFITAAFASRQYELLRDAFDDRVHQPYRKQLIPQLSAVIAAGTRAGALGGFLSGSGSAIICLTTSNALAVETAMMRAFGTGSSLVLKPDNRGLSTHRI